MTPPRRRCNQGYKPVAIKPQLLARLEAKAASQGCSKAVLIEYLLDYKELKHLDDLLADLKTQELQSFSITQLAHLSVLLTVLKNYELRFNL